MACAVACCLARRRRELGRVLCRALRIRARDAKDDDSVARLCIASRGRFIAQQRAGAARALKTEIDAEMLRQMRGTMLH